MYDVIGRYNTATIYALHVDSESYAQVLRMCNTEELQGSRIRMMPDMHASEGCTVGTSMTVTDKVNPAYVGGDIGCGMQVYRLRERTIDFAALDDAIRTRVPAGAAIFEHGLPAMRHVPLDALYSRDALRTATVRRSLGTLGGGNHFIEVDKDLEGNLYLVVHSGSRRLGRDVASYHQHVAFFTSHGYTPQEVAKRKLRVCDVQSRLHPSACFLTGEYMEQYLQDMRITVAYAVLNRKCIGEALLEALDLHAEESFTTVHNYIDTERGILRKGAVSAAEGEKLIIPINMRDGSLICIGKGNEEWNFTAPHGAGRLMKRSDAKAMISMEEYRAAMKGVYTTSVNESTLDESPMAYRGIDDILDAVEPTVDVVDVITPVYNFKASKPVTDEETMDGED